MRAALFLAGSIILAGCAVWPSSTPADLPIGSVSSPPAAPPAATMSAGGAGGVEVTGELGSWTLPSGGDSAPWISAGALDGTVEASVGDVLSVAMAGGPVASWNATYATAAETSPAQPTPLGSGGAAGGPGGFDVPAPPSGDWVVMIEIGYPGGGSGAYYWHVRTTG
jgi:hypothetical protein